MLMLASYVCVTALWLSLNVYCRLNAAWVFVCWSLLIVLVHGLVVPSAMRAFKFEWPETTVRTLWTAYTCTNTGCWYSSDAPCLLFTLISAPPPRFHLVRRILQQLFRLTKFVNLWLLWKCFSVFCWKTVASKKICGTSPLCLIQTRVRVLGCICIHGIRLQRCASKFVEAFELCHLSADKLAIATWKPIDYDDISLDIIPTTSETDYYLLEYIAPLRISYVTWLNVKDSGHPSCKLLSGSFDI